MLNILLLKGVLTDEIAKALQLQQTTIESYQLCSTLHQANPDAIAIVTSDRNSAPRREANN